MLVWQGFSIHLVGQEDVAVRTQGFLDRNGCLWACDLSSQYCTLFSISCGASMPSIPLKITCFTSKASTFSWLRPAQCCNTCRHGLCHRDSCAPVALAGSLQVSEHDCARRRVCKSPLSAGLAQVCDLPNLAYRFTGRSGQMFDSGIVSPRFRGPMPGQVVKLRVLQLVVGCLSARTPPPSPPSLQVKGQ